MSAIQNIKNFIRHGKQAKFTNAEPTTDISPVHAQKHGAISDPNILQHQPIQGGPDAGNHFSAAAVDNKNVAARAADAAAHAQGEHQKKHNTRDAKDIDPAVLERIVAEERESKGKLPKYPGLERWTLLEKMGDGAFSNVYRASDNQREYQEVAIKVVRKFEMNSSQRSNILKEVQIMRQLDHPNIVKLVDFHESRQYYFIILELCPGGELFHQIVRLTYFSEDLSRHVILQVAKALEYLHETAGVVHRDIKPENLLFYPAPLIPSKSRKLKPTDEEDKADEGEFVPGVGAGGIGVIKIADFGLSKVIWDSQTMTPCGTVGYTAPEIVKDERYSKSVDMWAMGCVLYTLLCGFPPFYDESIQTLTEKVARGQYTFLSPWWDEISQSAKDLISHLLTVDPDKRYDIHQFLDHPWIRESQEPTTSAADAPPSVSAMNNPALQYLEETPGASRGRDFRSPGAVNLREVFDVSYAVHRQEEEGKRRKNFKQGFRGAMNPLNEDDDEEQEFEAESAPYDPNQQHIPAKLPRSSNADVAGVETQMRNTSLSAAAQARQSNQPRAQERGYGQHSAAVAAAARRQVRQKGPFELSLENSTLLGRRGKKDPAPSGLREQVTSNAQLLESHDSFILYYKYMTAVANGSRRDCTFLLNNSVRRGDEVAGGKQFSAADLEWQGEWSPAPGHSVFLPLDLQRIESSFGRISSQVAFHFHFSHSTESSCYPPSNAAVDSRCVLSYLLGRQSGDFPIMTIPLKVFVRIQSAVEPSARLSTSDPEK
ncbi:Pkinase-domain-containing protein [Microthyrium microscopicum]|uniref:Pkinase-domain-containing protein n=1 Tax=Microthyrium microscopicum TaxID=703497 RepID=A0A6A6UD32_9PEZI|nr:Pkinase-domain-containing protein [Microthyrium microscopicum]